MREYSNSEITALIDEYIQGDKNRDVLKWRLVHKWTYQKISDKTEEAYPNEGVSVRTVGNILARELPKLAKHMK